MDNFFNETDNGTVLNSNTTVRKQPTPESKFHNFSIHTASIMEVVTPDNANSRSKKRTEYKAVINSGPKIGTVINGLHSLDSFGGDENYSEFVYKPKKKVLKGKDEGDRTIPEFTDASTVVVANIDGNFNNWIILGGLKNPNNGENVSKDDGIVWKGSFNGLTWKIDKDGNMNITRGSTTVDIKNNGNIEVKSSADTKITATGNTEITTSGTTQINSSGAMTLTGSSGINFVGPFVNLGGAGADQQLVRGNAFQTLFNTHTHPSNGSAPTQQMGSSHLSSKIKVE